MGHKQLRLIIYNDTYCRSTRESPRSTAVRHKVWERVLQRREWTHWPEGWAADAFSIPLQHIRESAKKMKAQQTYSDRNKRSWQILNIARRERVSFQISIFGTKFRRPTIEGFKLATSVLHIPLNTCLLRKVCYIHIYLKTKKGIGWAPCLSAERDWLTYAE